MKKMLIFAAIAVLFSNPSWSQQKVSAQQLARLFQQIDSQKITGAELEKLLEGQPSEKKQVVIVPESGPPVFWRVLGQVITPERDTVTMIEISLRELGFTTVTRTRDVRKAAIGKKIMVMGKEYVLAECPNETARLLCEQPIGGKNGDKRFVPFCTTSPDGIIRCAKQSGWNGKWKVEVECGENKEYAYHEWFPSQNFIFRIIRIK